MIFLRASFFGWLSLAVGLNLFAAGYAPAPNDRFWQLLTVNDVPETWISLWHLENRDKHGQAQGIDINARVAWAESRGAGVTIAIVDSGVDLAHPDLANQGRPELHWNFEHNTPNGEPPSELGFNHGTSVAGLAVAEGNNGKGIIGVAPEAKFASWVVLNTDLSKGVFVNSNALAQMFQSHLQEVQIQNHSWVKDSQRLVPLSDPENAAISNAVMKGRGGKGVVLVRAAGNARQSGRDVNEDAYLADPRAVTVAAVRFNGRVASYSTPGAPILVAAPSGDIHAPSDSNVIFTNLFSTDRVGQQGYNTITFPEDPEWADYVFGVLGFSGTSAAAPQVSGVVACMLSINPQLSYRDVQQILALAASQTDPDDPHLQENGAGFLVGRNTGFGLIDAGRAVEMAQQWVSRPSPELITVSVTGQQAIADAGLRVISESPGLPSELAVIPALPSLGVHADGATPMLPLVYVGEAAEPLQVDLRGKGALIRRGGTTFAKKFEHAAQAGAEFAVLFNNAGAFPIVLPATDFTRIPAVSIGQNEGEALASILTNQAVQTQIRSETVAYDFHVTEPLICGHVQLQLELSHQARGDLRVTLLSPHGTKSVLQRFGPDDRPIDGFWTYSSTHHFFESGQGTWRVLLSDEFLGGTGVVKSATLKIASYRIKDADGDGLDDSWEEAHFASLNQGPKDDPDLDGFSNAREQASGTAPNVNERPFRAEVARFNRSVLRLAWSSRPGVEYEVLGSSDLQNPFVPLAVIPGQFQTTSWFTPLAEGYRFFQVRRKDQ